MHKYFIVAAAAAVLLVAAGCGAKHSPSTPAATPTPVPRATASAPTPVPKAATAAPVKKIERGTGGAKIVKEEVDNLTRADLWVVMPNGDTLSQADIQQYMQNIVLNYVDEHDVTAVTLYVADNNEDVENSSYTLGMCTYYPGGEIGNAISTKPGDYSTFKFNFTISSRDDKEKPTDLEIEIYNYVNDELKVNSDEDAVNEKAASKYGITVDELNLIWAKVYTYKH